MGFQRLTALPLYIVSILNRGDPVNNNRFHFLFAIVLVIGMVLSCRRRIWQEIERLDSW